MRLILSSRWLKCWLSLIGCNSHHDLVKLFKRRHYLNRDERSFAVQHPIVFLFQNRQRIFLKAKCFSEQTFCSIAIQSPAGGLSRNGNSQAVVGLIVGEHKGGDQRAVVASAVLIHSSEITTTTQVDFHRR